MKNLSHANAFISWQLIAGLLVFTIMTLIVGQMGEDIANGRPLTQVDIKLTAWLQTHRRPGLTVALRMATHLGSTLIAVYAAAIVGFFLIRRRQLYWFTALWLSVFGGMGLNRLLKFAFQRPRPYFAEPILSLTGYSFPSGHTMTATVLYGVLAAYLASHTERLVARVLIILTACILIGLVGFSRIYLGAHYLSDVWGALAEGLAWLSLCLSILYSLWRRREYAQ